MWVGIEKSWAANPRLALGMVLGAAFVLRVLYSTEVSNTLDLIYLDRAATYIANLKQTQPSFLEALSQARTTMGGNRDLALYAPNLLAYSLFGVSRWTSILPSIAISVANAILIYLTALFFTRSNAAALLSSLFWAFLPLDIFYSTGVPRVEFLVFLSLLVIWIFLIATRSGGIWLYSAAFIPCLVILFLEPWALIAPAIFMIYIYFAGRGVGGLVRISLGEGIGLLMVVKWVGLGSLFLDFYTFILDQSEAVFLLPLMLVAVTVNQLEFSRGGNPYLALGGAFLVAFMGARLFATTPASIDIYNLGIYLLPFFASVVMLLGDYFSKGLAEREGAVWTITLSIAGTSGAALAVFGSREFLPSFMGLDWFGPHSLFMLFSILAGLAFAGALASPYLVTGEKTVWKTRLRFYLLIIVIFATLPYTWGRRNALHYLNEAPAQALAYIDKNQGSLPVYTLSERTYRQINFLSKMEDNSRNNEMVINLIRVEQLDQVQNGWVILFDGELDSAVPETWWWVGSFGSLGTPRIRLYELRTQERANDFLLNAQTDNVDLIEISSAMVNAGLFCEGYQKWKEAAQAEPNAFHVIPYQVHSGCVSQGENYVTIEDLRRGNRQGYIHFPSESQEPDSLNIAQVTLPIYDERTVSVSLDLQPRTLYQYSTEVRTTSPTSTLYWRAAESEDYLEMRSYPEWETVAVLIITPDWETVKSVTFFPVLFDHLDVVSLRNLFIGPVNLVPTQH